MFGSKSNLFLIRTLTTLYAKILHDDTPINDFANGKYNSIFHLRSYCGGLAMAFWYGSHKESRRDEKEFDEADIYNNDLYGLYDRPKYDRRTVKKVK